MTAQMDEALARLPHGPDFRFIDRVLELDPGRSGRGEYLVRGDEPFLRGHFPGEPIMPGVILLEAAAQLAGVVAQSDLEHQPLANLRLTGLAQAKILGTARPGQTVTFKAKVLGRLGRLVQVEVDASVAEVVVLRAQITLSGDDSPPV